MTFGSLFAGIGGFDLGLERAGMECRWQVEIDDYARRVLERHWPDVPRWDDARTFPPPSGEWGVDLICGGDPCQANSHARGDRPGGASEAAAFLSVVDAIRPLFVLRENPPSSRRAPWPWHRFRDCLERIGYAVLPFRIRACCLGGDHRRERVFLLAELCDPMRGGQPRDDWSQTSRTIAAERLQWPAVPVVRRSARRIPNRVDRIRTLGNAVAPQVAEWLGRQLIIIEGGTVSE